MTREQFANTIAKDIKPIPDSRGPNYFTIAVCGGSFNAPTVADVCRIMWDIANGDGSWELTA